jgi:DHA1 family inner membrane transport protein
MPWLPLLTLTLAAFAIGTTEFAVQGLLPEVAASLGVSIPQTGLLVTGYGLGVAVGGPIVAIAANGLRRKTILLFLLGIFIVGHVLGAIAPNYLVLMIARIVASFCHGSFMGVGSVVAVGIVREDRRASAVALMWAGIASANILGVPAGAAIGHSFGWRATFWAIAALGAIALAAIARWLPDGGPVERVKIAQEFRVLRKPQVLLTLALSVCVCAATFSVFTFIAPLLLDVTGATPGALPVYLLLFGTGGVIGMQIGGRFADRHLMASIIGAFIADAIVFLVLFVALREPAPAYLMMFVWGFSFYFMGAPIQLRVVEAAREAPNLASTMIHSGFNLGIAVGPIVSAAALANGLTYAHLPLCGAILSSIGIVLALWSARLDRREAFAAG